MSTALVWGANGGIGRALVEAFVSAGWTTVAIARNPEGLSALTPLVFEADLGEPHSVEQAIYRAALEVDAIDLWVYAAGDITSAKVSALPPADWERILNANLSGAYLSTFYSLPLLAEEAHLMYLGAVSERMQLPGLAAYAAAKSGLEAFAATLGKEQRKRRVTVVRPGAVKTPLWDKVPMRVPADAALPEKVAQAILEAYKNGHKGLLDLT